MIQLKAIITYGIVTGIIKTKMETIGCIVGYKSQQKFGKPNNVTQFSGTNPILSVMHTLILDQ